MNPNLIHKLKNIEGVKFLNCEVIGQLEADVMQNGFLTSQCRTVDCTNLIYTLDSKTVIYEMNGLFKMYVFNWQQDGKNIFDQKYLSKEFGAWKEKSLGQLGVLANVLVKDKII